MHLEEETKNGEPFVCQSVSLWVFLLLFFFPLSMDYVLLDSSFSFTAVRILTCVLLYIFSRIAVTFSQ